MPRLKTMTGCSKTGVDDRAFAPLRNLHAWYHALGVKQDDPLYIAPRDRARIR